MGGPDNFGAWHIYAETFIFAIAIFCRQPAAD